MTSAVDKVSTSRRPRDAQATREALLGSARAVFDESGYDRATTREIGERAGVDPALIARYFDSKEGLFLAAIAEADGEEVPDHAPRELFAFLIERWDERGHSPISRALASPSLTDDVRERVRSLVRERMLGDLAAELRKRRAPEPDLRAELLVALAVGVAMTRANGTLEGLAAAPREEILAAVEPLVQALGSAGPTR
jgi:AcrR family transcriptional regulator